MTGAGSSMSPAISDCSRPWQTVPFAALDSAIDDNRAGRARGSLVLLVEDRDAP